MSKCETCAYYEYQCGIAPSLARMMGNSNAPKQPTCTCHYSGITWVRRSAKVMKPQGTPCQYEKKLFICSDCGSHNTDRALITCSAKGEMVCRKCIDKHYAEYQKKKDAALTGSEPDVRKCRVCGCTDDHACPGGCYWVEEDLCSQCEGKE